MRAGRFDGRSGYDLLVTLLPFPVLLGIITLIQFSPPDDSRAGSNLADGGFTRRRIFRDSDFPGSFSAPWGGRAVCEETKSATAVVLTPPPGGTVFS